MLALAAVSAALALSACATGTPSLVEQGYERGALGVAAIGRGDYAKAEALILDARGAKMSDPARLINLGTVYMQTGRTAQALGAWRQALASDKHFTVETADGRVVSTRELAGEAIARHERVIQTAGR
jgi:Flp pilus assembly protein TadD